MAADRSTFADEPPLARGVVAPAALAGFALLLVHTIIAATVGAISATATPGPETAGGAWDVAVWVVALAAGGAAARPVVRRSTRPWLVGLAAGVVAAALYAVIAVAASEGATPALPGRVASLVGAGALVGALTRPGPPAA